MNEANYDLLRMPETVSKVVADDIDLLIQPTINVSLRLLNAGNQSHADISGAPRNGFARNTADDSRQAA